MPNWVFNGLTIEGPKESVTKLVEQMNTPFVDYIEPNGDLAFGVKQTKYSNPIFSFRNIIAPTDLEAYKGQPARTDVDINDPEWWAKTQELAKTDNSWYNWNIRNWGTKWDVAVPNESLNSDTYMEGPVENGENLAVYYNFNTAWGVPEAALTNLSSQYPDLLFTLSYEEETGWGGEAEFLRGKIISDNQYGWKCRECDHTEEETPYCEECEYDMCPSCGYGEPVDTCQTHMVESGTQLKENA
jgi:hypothetical protein